MNVIEINKYPPSLYRRARYLTADWTSVQQIGETWSGVVLTAAAYLAVEDRYVRAAAHLMAVANVTELRVHNLEFWEASHVPAHPALALPERVAPRDGDAVSGADLEALLRRFLRELAWAELVVAPDFLLHPGYDLRLVVATTAETAAAEAAIRQDGLFTYPGDTNLATLEAWRPPFPERR